ncbi:MAG: YitT family protein [Lachnospiraceae bacterium]
MNRQKYFFNSWSSLFQTLSSLFLVAAGNFLYVLTVQLFLLPSGLVTGGTTGIALTVHHFFHIPVTQFVLLFNVVMLIAGFLILGKQFAATTLASTFLYPFALEVFDRLFGGYVITGDLLLSTLFSGLGIGAALGIVIRAGASTGGMDIPPLILQKTVRVPVSVSMYAFDVCILLVQALFRPVENILYGIVLVLIYTVVLDKMLLMGTARTEIKVISAKSDEIRNAIMTRIDRGVTMLDGEGGYLHHKTQIVMSIISNRELPKVEKVIRSIAPESFLVISRVKEVSGRGFSMKKRYR